MDNKSIIETALNGYLVEVQFDSHHYGNDKRKIILSYLSYIRDGGIISDEWLKNKAIISEALKLYKKTLEDERNADPTYNEECKMVNKLICKTQSV